MRDQLEPWPSNSERMAAAPTRWRGFSSRVLSVVIWLVGLALKGSSSLTWALQEREAWLVRRREYLKLKSEKGWR